jgi:phage terminase small subunit
MAKTGYRPGAGRPRAAGAGRPRVQRLTLSDLLTEEQKAGEQKRVGLSPLEYMLAVMNDPTVDPIRRDRMAMAAAPFLHVKADTVALGKKQQAEQEAKVADRNTGWEGILQRDRVGNRATRLAV